MLNHHALALLASPKLPSPSSQRALQLFADYDLSLPRKLWTEELDQRYSWKAGAARKLISQLCQLGLLMDLNRRQSESTVLQLAPGYCWTPRSLAEQWRCMQESNERRDQVSASGSRPAAY